VIYIQQLSFRVRNKVRYFNPSRKFLSTTLACQPWPTRYW